VQEACHQGDLLLLNNLVVLLLLLGAAADLALLSCPVTTALPRGAHVRTPRNCANQGKLLTV
jgi:cytochrome c oxidase assembly factor CtaG